MSDAPVTEQTVEPMTPTEPVRRRSRYGKGRKALDAMTATPGEWVRHRTGQTQHQAHSYASWLRKTYPTAEWVARKDGDTYAVFGRIVIAAAPDPEG